MDVIAKGGSSEENQQLKKLAEETFKDAGLGKKLSKMVLLSDIGLPAFYVGCRFKKDVQPILLKNIARIRELSSSIKLQITDERYYGQVIETLRKHLGRENVEQDERNVIMVQGRHDDIGDIVIYDYTEEIRERIIDLLWHILPEGFKVRHFKHFDDGFILIATDIPKMREFYEQINRIAKEFGGEWDV